MCATLTPTSSLSDPETAPSSSSEYGTEICDDKGGSKQRNAARWRPAYHVQPDTPSWINDPCAPFYNSKSGLYYVSFQWNPSGPDWGDITWGTATSPDMINWTIQDQPSLLPDEPFDHKGIFTGCFMPSDDDKNLTYAYTSVSRLPIHHTLPHSRGSESLSLARSYDCGKTWSKLDCNPILPGEPEGLDVTGWRDPFVSKWPSMAHFLELDADTSFGIISGGIRDKTPTTFLYVIDPMDQTRWRYIGPLADFGLNFTPSRWSGDLGKNWEVSNFLTLGDDFDPAAQESIVVCGTEGCTQQRSQIKPPSAGPSRPARQQLWFAGNIQASNGPGYMGPVEMSYEFGGHLDHGNLYAANSFFDPKTLRHIVWGWIGEDDLSDELRYLQGWSGLLSMPRELRMMTIEHVIGASVSELQSVTSIGAIKDQHGSYTIRTLASQPYQPLIDNLRRKPGVQFSELSNAGLTSGVHSVVFDRSAVQTMQWELDATFYVSQQAHKIGVTIAHSADSAQTTTLVFDQLSETFTITRPSFSCANSPGLINSSPEIAPHTLFHKQDPVTGVVEKEKLCIRAWRDNSVLEVFVNERTAISTRLYAAESTIDVRFFVDDQDLPNDICERSEVVSARLWDGIGI